MNVYIMNSDSFYSQMFKEWGYDVVDEDHLEIDLLVFTGGTDISPYIYGHETLPFTDDSDVSRDVKEMQVYDIARENQIACVGFCRGGQLLNALNEGALVQHVTGHDRGSHYVTTSDGKDMLVTSSHHQMMVPGDKAEVLAWSKDNLSLEYHIDGDLSPIPLGVEPEVISYDTTDTLCIQPHPEWMESGAEFRERCRKWVGNLVRDSGRM